MTDEKVRRAMKRLQALWDSCGGGLVIIGKSFASVMEDSCTADRVDRSNDQLFDSPSEAIEELFEKRQQRLLDESAELVRKLERMKS